MTTVTATTTAQVRTEPELFGQTVVVVGGSAGVGRETARRARAEGAEVILTGPDELEAFFAELPAPIDHVIVTAGSPYHERLTEMDFPRARRFLDQHLMMPLKVARHAAGKLRPGGTLLFVDGAGAHRAGAGLALESAVTVGMPTLVASLALELAPVRVNLIAAATVTSPLDTHAAGPDDVAAVAVQVMASSALTGATYDIDRGRQILPRGV